MDAPSSLQHHPYQVASKFLRERTSNQNKKNLEKHNNNDDNNNKNLNQNTDADAEGANNGNSILFVMTSGSNAYNLAVEGSDIDYLGVYLAPSVDVLSIQIKHRGKLFAF